MKVMTFLSVAITILMLLLPARSFSGDRKIKVTANPVSSDISRGMIVNVPIIIDVSEFDFELGSFTASLEWDNATLEFESYTGGWTNGFDNPVVNTQGAAKGKLIFANAVPQGAKGKVNVFNLEFKAIGKSGQKSSVKLTFTAMAAAKSFENLLPYLDSKGIDSNVISIGSNSTGFKLENYPNPFNPATRISYSLPLSGLVNIILYNTLGEQVRVLLNEEQEAGQHTIEWDSRNDHHKVLPTGVYILRMQAKGIIIDKKLLLIK